MDEQDGIEFEGAETAQQPAFEAVETAERQDEGGPDLAAVVAERDRVIAEQQAVQAELIARVRASLLATDPDVEPELVAGESLAELEASFAAAQEMAVRMRRRVERRAAATVPAGAPGRVAQAPNSPLAKIRAGLGSR